MPDEQAIRGGCLCGGVRFEVARLEGPFELCHCRRCRKVSGSAFLAGVGVKAKDLRLLRGAELITHFELPQAEEPPPYRSAFCSRCGSPVPSPREHETSVEVPAGLFDDDLRCTPDRHIFIHAKADWYEISDSLPQFDKEALRKLRKQRPPT